MTRRVLCGEFSHETNTFSVQPADVAAFERRLCIIGDEAPLALDNTNTEMGGFMEAAKRYQWRLLHTVTTTATPSGKVTDSAWERFTGRILERAKSVSQLDGVILALHGAMVTESYDDAEGELLQSIRAAIGPGVPIAITLDLHANLSPRTATLADIVCSYKTYPHIDMRARGRQAGDLLEAAMSKAVSPRTVHARRATLLGADGGRSDREPMIGLLAKANALEREPGCLCVSINAGFPLADIYDAGPSVTVTGDGKSGRFQEMAEALMEDIWETRDVVNNVYLSVEEAADIARSRPESGRPLIIADYADNPGAGSYGDATGLLRAMLDAGLENACFGALRDEAAALALCEAGEGSDVSIDLGGKVAPALGGPPLRVRGKVVSVSDGRFVYEGPMWAGMPGAFGPSAVLRVEGVEILVVSNLMQITDLQQFKSNRLDPLAKRTVALKSMQHFRAAYEPIADQVIVCDSGALASPDIFRLRYDKLRRPIDPFDRV